MYASTGLFLGGRGGGVVSCGSSTMMEGESMVECLVRERGVDGERKESNEMLCVLLRLMLLLVVV